MATDGDASIEGRESEAGRTNRGRFTTTHWSLVAAAVGTDSAQAMQAMDQLCRTYWYPLYAFLRRKGLDAHEAEDVTQDFFAQRVVSGKIFEGPTAAGGRFRTWLLNSLQNHLFNHWDRQHALKRGGNQQHLPLDLEAVEKRYALERRDATPEKIYDRAWAATLLERALVGLRARYVQAGKAVFFEQVTCFLPGAFQPMTYAQVAARLGKTEGALKMAVSRLKQEYGKAVRDEIRRTVSTKAEADEELRHLLAVVGD